MMRFEKGDIIIIRNKNQTYTSKPCPAIAYQDSIFGNKVESLTIILLSSTILDADPFRVTLMPNKENGLSQMSQAMTDKITTIHKSDIGNKIGVVDNLHLQKIDEALKLWLNIN